MRNPHPGLPSDILGECVTLTTNGFGLIGQTEHNPSPPQKIYLVKSQMNACILICTSPTRGSTEYLNGDRCCLRRGPVSAASTARALSHLQKHFLATSGVSGCWAEKSEAQHEADPADKNKTSARDSRLRTSRMEDCLR